MYPPHHFGGYELVWHSAVEHLRARGNEVEVLATDARTGSHRPDGAGVHRELRWPLRDAQFENLAPRARLELARHNHRTVVRRLDEFRPDVVAWWAMGGLTLGMLETVRRRELPAVAFVHDDWLDYGRWADAWLHTFRGRRARVAPIAERLSASRSRHVGRLDPRKGGDTVVEALAHLPAQARLELVGGWDTAEEARLRRLAAGAGVEQRVHRGPPRARGDSARIRASGCGGVPRSPGGAMGVGAPRGDGQGASGHRDGPGWLG